MIYSVVFSKRAEKELEKLERNMQERIIGALERCRIRPYAHVKKLAGDAAFRLRVGDYRVIMDIDNGQLRILVIEIGHRRNVYEK